MTQCSFVLSVMQLILIFHHRPGTMSAQSYLADETDLKTVYHEELALVAPSTFSDYYPTLDSDYNWEAQVCGRRSHEVQS